MEVIVNRIHQSESNVFILFCLAWNRAWRWPRRVRQLVGLAVDLCVKGDWQLTGLWRLALWPSFVHAAWPMWALTGGSGFGCGRRHRGWQPPSVPTLSLRRWGTVPLSPQRGVDPNSWGRYWGHRDHWGTCCCTHEVWGEPMHLVLRHLRLPQHLGQCLRS
jgi:hypothetical protein